MPFVPEAVPTSERIYVPGYEILEELGRGGMGVVYKARQTSLNRIVALKMVLSGCHASPSDLARFRREAEAVARLQHPGIVQIHEVGEHEGLPFYSMEYVDGGSLENHLEGRPLPPRLAAQLIEAMARAVQHAHQHHVVHRDLKPANVLLSGAWCVARGEKQSGSFSLATRHAARATPKITDFGLAKLLDEIGPTQTGAALGTPSYMAPEQAGGRKDVGPLADVYALGAILYQLLTGRPPFVAATAMDTLIQVVAEEPVPPRRLCPAIPRDLETTCLKCLEKDPARRYASAEELADDLVAFLAGEPIRARPPGWGGRLVRWAAQRPALAGTLCALLVFYGNHLFLMATGFEGEGGSFHLFVTALVLVWAAGALAFHRLTGNPRWRWPATYGWAALDVVLFTALLLVAAGPKSALLVLYPLLIAGAGLRFRIPLVWFVTGLSIASYLILQADAVWRRPEAGFAARSHDASIFVLSLAIMGLIVSLLLRRFRLALANEN